MKTDGFRVLKIESIKWEGKVPIFVVDTFEEMQNNMEKWKNITKNDYICFKMLKEELPDKIYIKQPDGWCGEYEDKEILTVPWQSEGPSVDFDWDIEEKLKANGMEDVVDAAAKLADEILKEVNE